MVRHFLTIVLIAFCAVGISSYDSQGGSESNGTILGDAIPLSVGDLFTGIQDNGIYTVPQTGPYAYSSFKPSFNDFISRSDSYIDPIFGNKIFRVTDRETTQSGDGWGYVRNGFGNANGTLFIGNSASGHAIIEIPSGNIIKSSPPGHPNEVSFDPVDPNIYYYPSGSGLYQYIIDQDQSTLVRTFSSNLNSHGGSVDWITADGNHALIVVGNELKVYDISTDQIYSGSIPYSGGSGWAGITPNGSHVVVTGYGPGLWEHASFAIDHSFNSLSSEPTYFWNLCGDHADLMSESNGRSYAIFFGCYSEPGIWAVDISIPQTMDHSEASREKQKNDALKLLSLTWEDSGHLSGISKGPRKEWVIISLNIGGKGSNDASQVTWTPYQNEIIAANILTGEYYRLAHHRSDVIGGPDGYTTQVRAMATWDGSGILFQSNYGASEDHEGYSDYYFLTLKKSQ